MAIDLSCIGVEQGPHELWWNSSHCLLYAVAVGCDGEDLSFVTENSSDVEQRVLPTFICTVGEAARLFSQRPGEGPLATAALADSQIRLSFGEIESSKLLHAFERFQLHSSIPTEARVHVWSSVTAIWDKGDAAVVEIDHRAHDADTAALLYSKTHGLYIRGAGGFGGDRGPANSSRMLPERPPDEQITYTTQPSQSYLYRLAYGRHPLFSDPVFAQQAGFEQPILAGMCTYGFTGRGLLQVLCDGDPSRFVSMEGRFAAPVFGGDTLTVKIWIEGNSAQFITETQRGDFAITHGSCRFT